MRRFGPRTNRPTGHSNSPAAVNALAMQTIGCGLKTPARKRDVGQAEALKMRPQAQFWWGWRMSTKAEEPVADQARAKPAVNWGVPSRITSKGCIYSGARST